MLLARGEGPYKWTDPATSENISVCSSRSTVPAPPRPSQTPSAPLNSLLNISSTPPQATIAGAATASALKLCQDRLFKIAFALSAAEKACQGRHGFAITMESVVVWLVTVKVHPVSRASPYLTSWRLVVPNWARVLPAPKTMMAGLTAQLACTGCGALPLGLLRRHPRRLKHQRQIPTPVTESGYPTTPTKIFQKWKTIARRKR